MLKMKRNGEVALATMILFIALILVAAITVGILITSSDAVNTKALVTAKDTAEDIGYSFQMIEIYGEDGSSSNSVDYLYAMLKVSSGSGEGAFNQTMVELSLKNNSASYEYIHNVTYQYNWTVWNNSNCSNASVVSVTLVNVSYPVNCSNYNATIYIQNVNYSINVNSSGTVCPQNASNTSTSVQNITLQNTSATLPATNHFSVTKTKPASGTIDHRFIGGDIFQFCIKSPRSIVQDEKVMVNYVPTKGDPVRTEFTMPAVINKQKEYLFP